MPSAANSDSADAASPAGRHPSGSVGPGPLNVAGGIAAIGIGVGYVIVIGLFASAGAPPVGGEAWLAYLADKTNTWWAIVLVSVVTNFLFVPVVLALYQLLAAYHRTAMMIAAAFVGLFVTLELAVNWTSYGALLVMSEDYAAADAGERAALVAAAGFPSAVIESPLALVYAVGTLSLAVLIIGLVMRGGVFNRLTAYLGIVTGVLGLAAVAGFDLAVILNAVGATVWVLLVGVKLITMAR